MRHLSDPLLQEHSRSLDAVARLSAAAGVPVWLVGGTVRDLLLGLAVKDLDLVLPKADFPRLTKALAKEIDAAIVPLDPDFPTVRLVPHNGAPHVDLSGLQGDTLDEDLHRRDFTINAMAVPVLPQQGQAEATDGKKHPVVDLFGGRADLVSGTIRAISSGIFEDDPLRLLRAARFMATLGFCVEPATVTLITRESAKLGRVSVERKRDELLQLLDAPAAVAALAAVTSWGLLPLALMSANSEPPQPGDTLAAERLLGWLTPGGALADLWEHTATACEPVRPQRPLAALALLLAAREPGLPASATREARVLSERFRLSHLEGRFLADMLGVIAASNEHPSVVELGGLAGSAQWYWRWGDRSLVGLLVLHAVLDSPAELARRALLEAALHWRERFAQRVHARPPVNGEILMRDFGAKPGKELGRLLREYHYRWFCGEYETLEQASALFAEISHAIAGSEYIEPQPFGGEFPARQRGS